MQGSVAVRAIRFLFLRLLHLLLLLRDKDYPLSSSDASAHGNHQFEFKYPNTEDLLTFLFFVLLFLQADFVEGGEQFSLRFFDGGE